VIAPSVRVVGLSFKQSGHHDTHGYMIVSMRYLAIDPGDKRIGLAIGDEETGIASPIAVIESTSENERLRRIRQVIDEHRPGALIVGLALHMDGTQGVGAKKAQALAQQLTQEFGLEAILVDERLSSFAADNQMTQTGLTRQGKKRRRDALAAAAILRTYFDSR